MALDILNNVAVLQDGSISPYVGGGQGNWFYIDYNMLIANADEADTVKAFYITRISDFEVEFFSFGNWIPFSAISKKIIMVLDYTKETNTTYFYFTLMRVKAPYIYYGALPFFYVRALTNKNSPSSNYWSIKEILVYCDILYTNTSPVLTFINTLETLTPNKFYISYDLLLENSDGYDFESIPIFKVTNVLNGIVLKSGHFVSAPFIIEPNEYITWQYDTTEDVIIPAFTVVLNDLNADSSSDIEVMIHCNKKDNLSIDINSYLSIFGKNLSSNNVKCFKCGFPLSLNQSNLKCINSHIYEFEDYIYEHSSYLASLVQAVKENNVCDK